jgi:glycosyltransferase involved in cell wall biosynthesis
VPQVSILVPSYNHEKYAAATIESVLAQSFTDFELIINDDASTDGTFAELEKYKDPRILLMRNDRNLGPCATSEVCWQKSRGELVTWLATDDIYEPNALHKLVGFLNDGQELDGAFGLARFIDDDGKLTGQSWTAEGVNLNRFELLRSLFYGQNPFCAAASMVRRSIVERVGYRKAHLVQLSDLEHWARMLFVGELKIFPEPIVRYRQRANDGNLSAPTEVVSARSQFEHFELLALFVEKISSIEILKSIFPNVSSLGFPIEAELIPFLLAQLALESDCYGARLFAVHTLFSLMADPAKRELLERKCNFTNPDLFKLEAAQIRFLAGEPVDLILLKEKLRVQEEKSNEEMTRNAQLSKANNKLSNKIDGLRNELNSNKIHAQEQARAIEELQSAKNRLRVEHAKVCEELAETRATSVEQAAQIRDWKDSNEELSKIVNQQAKQLNRRSAQIAIKLASFGNVFRRKL